MLISLSMARYYRMQVSRPKKAQYPHAFRKAWSSFQSYNLDEQVDLRALAVVDIGDVAIHTTDKMISESAIEAAAESLSVAYQKSFTCLIGGDHAITACSLRGIKKCFSTGSYWCYST